MIDHLWEWRELFSLERITMRICMFCWSNGYLKFLCTRSFTLSPPDISRKPTRTASTSTTLKRVYGQSQPIPPMTVAISLTCYTSNIQSLHLRASRVAEPSSEPILLRPRRTVIVVVVIISSTIIARIPRPVLTTSTGCSRATHLHAQAVRLAGTMAGMSVVKGIFQAWCRGFGHPQNRRRARRSYRRRLWSRHFCAKSRRKLQEIFVVRRRGVSCR